VNISIDHGKEHVVIKRMLPYWKSDGHQITIKGDIHLSFIKFIQQSNVPKVLRLDGIYYDNDTDYNKRNLLISKSHYIANGVIYQSNFSKKMCEKYLSPRNFNAKTSVIYNGVDNMWCGKHIDTNNFNIIVSSKWRRHKRLKEIIDLFIIFHKLHKDARLHILGDTIQNKKYDHPSIIYYGHLNENEMKPVWRIGDLSIHLSKKDSCPNTVVEAIGAGVPVITTNACGGATEMVNITKGCISCSGEEQNIQPCYPYRDEYNVISDTTSQLILNAITDVYKDRPRVIIPKQLTIKYMATQYTNFMKDLL